MSDCDPVDCSSPASLSITNSRSLLRLICQLSWWCHPTICLSLLLLPSIFPASGSFPMSEHFASRVKVLEFQSLSISPSNEYSGLISFRMDWLDLLVVQGTLQSLLQHHSSKASILQRSAFFIVQLSHPYITTGKTIALIGRTFVGKVMSLLFSMLSRLVTAFLPRSRHLLISWLQSPCSHRVFSNESVLHIRCQTIAASASASVFPMNIQD